MYKDKDKQREANAERQRRYKAKQKALPEQGVTDKVLRGGVCVSGRNWVDVMEHSLKRGKDIKVFADLPVDRRRRIIAAAYTCPCIVLGKPGDADYNGVCTDE